MATGVAPQQTYFQVGQLVTRENQHVDEFGRILTVSRTTIDLIECQRCAAIIQRSSSWKHDQWHFHEDEWVRDPE